MSKENHFEVHRRGFAIRRFVEECHVDRSTSSPRLPVSSAVLERASIEIGVSAILTITTVATTPPRPLRKPRLKPPEKVSKSQTRLRILQNPYTSRPSPQGRS